MDALIREFQRELFPEFYREKDEIFRNLQEELPQIRESLEQDLAAALAVDPAAKGAQEVALCYPGFYALTVYRLANALLRKGIPLLPRQLTEWAHRQTGIDIHPGATIGPGCFIDHGTGIVIGETAVVGRNVTLYHGVTLGALVTHRGLQGIKRHPTVEDGVTVYANATILGGDTVIGKNSVIGANAFVTTSVPPDRVVSVCHPELMVR